MENIITLCGSTKFKKEFEYINKILTVNEKIILQPGCFAHHDKIDINYKTKINLDDLHKKKINLSECILVINKNNYIGSSTLNEIQHAKTQNKSIYYMYNKEGEITDLIKKYVNKYYNSVNET